MPSYHVHCSYIAQKPMTITEIRAMLDAKAVLMYTNSLDTCAEQLLNKNYLHPRLAARSWLDGHLGHLSEAIIVNRWYINTHFLVCVPAPPVRL